MGTQLKNIFSKNKKNKIGIIVEARSNSSRLPNKHFLLVLKKPIIEFLIKRLKKVSNVDEIIIATTTKKNDDKLCMIAKKHSIKFFRGSEENVTERVLKAAKKYKVEIICRVTGDCPIIDPYLIEQLVDTFLVNFGKIDYVSNSQLGLPNGMGCEVFSRKALNKSYSKILKKDEYEHVSLNIRRQKIFKKIYLMPLKQLSWGSLGLTLDEYKDFILIKKLIEYFNKRKQLITCKKVIKLLKKKNWHKINNRVKRKDNKLKI